MTDAPNGDDSSADIQATISKADHVCVDSALGPRERGMLAPIDRQYLRGEKEYSHRQSAYARREETRERVYNGLLDFELLFHHMDDKELERIFDPPEDDASYFHAALADIIALLYYEQSVSTPSFETLLQRGINRAEQRYASGEAYHVDVDLTIERRTPEKADLEAVADELAGPGPTQVDEIPDDALRTFVEYYAKSDEFDPEIPQQEFEDSHGEILDQISEAVEERQRSRREKQGRKQESDVQEE